MIEICHLCGGEGIVYWIEEMIFPDPIASDGTHWEKVQAQDVCPECKGDQYVVCGDDHG